MQSGVSYLFPILEFTDSSPASNVDQPSPSDYIVPATQPLSPPPSSTGDDHSISIPIVISTEHSSSPAELRRSSRPFKPLVWITDYVVQPKKSSCQYPVSHYVSYDQISSTYQASLAAYSAIV